MIALALLLTTAGAIAGFIPHVLNIRDERKHESAMRDARVMRGTVEDRVRRAGI